MKTDNLEATLKRPSDDLPKQAEAADKPPEADKSKPKKVKDDELAALREQNEALMNMVMEMRAKLMPDSEEKKRSDALMFDKKKPFAKHRSAENGVWYEQNGRKYNGKFELVKNVDVPTTV